MPLFENMPYGLLFVVDWHYNTKPLAYLVGLVIRISTHTDWILVGG